MNLHFFVGCMSCVSPSSSGGRECHAPAESPSGRQRRFRVFGRAKCGWDLKKLIHSWFTLNKWWLSHKKWWFSIVFCEFTRGWISPLAQGLVNGHFLNINSCGYKFRQMWKTSPKRDIYQPLFSKTGDCTSARWFRYWLILMCISQECHKNASVSMFVYVSHCIMICTPAMFDVPSRYNGCSPQNSLFGWAIRSF